MHEHDNVQQAETAAQAAGRRDGRSDLKQFASRVGNRNLGRIVARLKDGEGILPDRGVHPDVEAAIAAARGRGRPLDRSVRAMLEPALGTSLDTVRVHADSDLPPKVSALAFTVGADIHFDRGLYRPDTPDGRRLIAHEVLHTVQQRGAPATGSLTVSDRRDASEQEAEGFARDVAG